MSVIVTQIYQVVIKCIFHDLCKSLYSVLMSFSIILGLWFYHISYKILLQQILL
ncbi:hypothetical protein Lalb_Chr09g0327971 [Lupinus albus]|uniref:Uncharacterized protein n=1 Tax=Lupinus albus TaxID=3870 RepID=A0A6A4Q0A0_LUPAL|nr:hypothetical protein Lalb_Chr09g0327971 [Lupinus albus]